MNKKFFLTLLSSPVLFASVTSMVMMIQPAHAVQVVQKVSPDGTRLSCVKDPHTATPKMVCIKVSKNAVNTPKKQVQVAQVNPNQQPTELAFTDQESDEAIRLFNCDCPVCLNAVRALHGLQPVTS